VKALLAIIGLFAGTAVVVVFGGLWLMAATTPDQSALSREVGVTVLGAREERRASSTKRFGYRVEYSYRVDGTAYVADRFVPLARWRPGWPLQACVDPRSPAEHALRLPRDPPCGENVGDQHAATPVGGS
jgi:hypothetical protein